LASRRNHAQKGETVRVISAATGAGVPAALRAILAEIDRAPRAGAKTLAAALWLP
jgi:hypothetical protein